MVKSVLGFHPCATLAGKFLRVYLFARSHLPLRSNDDERRPCHAVPHCSANNEEVLGTPRIH